VTLQDTTAKVAGSVVPSSATIVVSIVPTITIPQSSTTIAPGQSANIPVNFAGGTADAGITFTTTCSVVPAGGPGCSVSPSTLTLDSNGNGSVVVTVTANGFGTALFVPQGDAWPRLPLAPLFVPLGLALVFLAKGFPGSSVRRRSRWGLAVLLFATMVMLATGACTNVRTSDIGCTACTAAGSYTVTVSAKSLKPPLQTTGVFTVIVTP
jgi:hypothetical protein